MLLQSQTEKALTLAEVIEYVTLWNNTPEYELGLTFHDGRNGKAVWSRDKCLLILSKSKPGEVRFVADNYYHQESIPKDAMQAIDRLNRLLHDSYHCTGSMGLLPRQAEISRLEYMAVYPITPQAEAQVKDNWRKDKPEITDAELAERWKDHYQAVQDARAELGNYNGETERRDELAIGQAVAEILGAGEGQGELGSTGIGKIELHIEDIDSFAKARDIGPQAVKSLVPLDLLEDQVQTFFEQIIGENFHQEDCGGEMNDVVSSQVKVSGRRLRAAFILKGRGTKGKLTIKGCGKNSDQIVRLVEAPVDLYVIQHVDEIDQRVVYDLKGKVELKNEKGEPCQMCIIDGTDTARILVAYGKIDGAS